MSRHLSDPGEFSGLVQQRQQMLGRSHVAPVHGLGVDPQVVVHGVSLEGLQRFSDCSHGGDIGVGCGLLFRVVPFLS